MSDIKKEHAEQGIVSRFVEPDNPYLVDFVAVYYAGMFQGEEVATVEFYRGGKRECTVGITRRMWEEIGRVAGPLAWDGLKARLKAS